MPRRRGEPQNAASPSPADRGRLEEQLPDARSYGSDEAHNQRYRACRERDQAALRAERLHTRIADLEPHRVW